MRRFRTRLVAILALGLAGSAAGDWAGPGLDDAQLAQYHAACATYDNRARFRPRTGEVAFVVLMAEGCAAAQETLETGGPAERHAAAGYLDRLVELRDTVIGINMDRIYGANASPFARPKARHGTMRPLGEVSEAGEFLIAHRMGLMAAFRLWAARAPEFTLALGRAPKG